MKLTLKKCINALSTNATQDENRMREIWDDKCVFTDPLTKTESLDKFIKHIQFYKIFGSFEKISISKCTLSKNVAISKGCLNYRLNMGFFKPNINIDFVTYMEFKNDKVIRHDDYWGNIRLGT
jgi:hypothetical protein